MHHACGVCSIYEFVFMFVRRVFQRMHACMLSFTNNDEHTYSCVHVCIYYGVYMYLCMHHSMHVYVCMYVCVCVHVCTYEYVCVCVRMCVSMHACMYVCVCMCMHV